MNLKYEGEDGNNWKMSKIVLTTNKILPTESTDIDVLVSVNCMLMFYLGRYLRNFGLSADLHFQWALPRDAHTSVLIDMPNMPYGQNKTLLFYLFQQFYIKKKPYKMLQIAQQRFKKQ